MLQAEFVLGVSWAHLRPRAAGLPGFRWYDHTRVDENGPGPLPALTCRLLTCQVGHEKSPGFLLLHRLGVSRVPPKNWNHCWQREELQIQFTGNLSNPSLVFFSAQFVFIQAFETLHWTPPNRSFAKGRGPAQIAKVFPIFPRQSFWSRNCQDRGARDDLYARSS